MKAASHVFSFMKVPAALSRYRLRLLFAQPDQAAKSEVTEEGNLFVQVWKIKKKKKSFRVDLACGNVMAEKDFYSEGGSWMRELASVTENV